jgi:hypothetical protein
MEWRDEDNRNFWQKLRQTISTETLQGDATAGFNKSIEVVTKRPEVENLMTITLGVNKGAAAGGPIAYLRRRNVPST